MNRQNFYTRIWSNPKFRNFRRETVLRTYAFLRSLIGVCHLKSCVDAGRTLLQSPLARRDSLRRLCRVEMLSKVQLP